MRSKKDRLKKLGLKVRSKGTRTDTEAMNTSCGHTGTNCNFSS